MEEEVDPIVELTHKLELLIQKTVSIESLDSKLTQLVQKLAEITTTLDLTHDLVNSRMTQLTKALEKAAENATLLAGEEGEERGIAIGRKQADEKPPDSAGSG